MTEIPSKQGNSCSLNKTSLLLSESSQYILRKSEQKPLNPLTGLWIIYLMNCVTWKILERRKNNLWHANVGWVKNVPSRTTVYCVHDILLQPSEKKIKISITERCTTTSSHQRHSLRAFDLYFICIVSCVFVFPLNTEWSWEKSITHYSAVFMGLHHFAHNPLLFAVSDFKKYLISTAKSFQYIQPYYIWTHHWDTKSTFASQLVYWTNLQHITQLCVSC